MLGLLIGAAFAVGSFVFARWLVGLPFGERGLVDALAPWAFASGRLRAARAAGGICGWYLGAAIAFALGTMSTGEVVVDETSMRVKVAPGGPAAEAGIENGDRIVAVEGESIEHWDQLKQRLALHAGEPTRVTIERNTVRSDVEVVPGESRPTRGKILVGPFTETRPVGFGAALGSGLVAPFSVVGGTARAFVRAFTGREEVVVVSGPVGIVREVEQAPRSVTATGMKLAAALASYVWPVVTVLSIGFAFLRRRGSRSTSVRA